MTIGRGEAAGGSKENENYFETHLVHRRHPERSEA
jgi:hypothetical protein